jgi:drug/metabolite transporter (DMT)-like permease
VRIPTTVRWGVGLAAATAVISGVSIYLNGLFIDEFPSPTVLAAARNGLVGAGLVVFFVAAGGVRSEVRRLSPRQLAGLLVIGVIGGSVPFALFFNGLAAASSPSAAFIQKTLFIWVALLAVPLLGERVGRWQLVALGVLLAGSWLLAAPSGVSLGGGELMIAAATGLWAVEVILAKRLLGDMGSLTVATARMAIGGGLLLAFVLIDGKASALGQISALGWLFIAITAGLLTGYVLTWFAALKRAPATMVTSVLVGGAVITGVLNAIGTGGLPGTGQVQGLALILVGVVLIGAVALVGRRFGGRTVEPAG